MIPVTLTQLVTILDATLIHPQNTVVNEVTTDTRKVNKGALFIALKGENFDGHQFVEEAFNKGACAVVVEKELPLDVPQLVVKDTRLALGHLAHWVRIQSSARVVALTGSSGKTSVKEMTAAILQRCGHVLYTAGNLNNDIGVPLTLLRLTPEHQFAVIELGANHIGEIAYTVDITQPEAALVNNLAAAHLEGFGSLAGVAKAKGEIFASLPDSGIAVINLDSHDLLQWQSVLSNKKVWFFSIDKRPESDFYASHVNLNENGTQFVMTTPIGDCDIALPLLGSHNIANALAASALAIAVGADLTAIQDGLKSVSAVKGRLYPVKLGQNQLLLDDTYNANVGSMIAAAHVLSTMPGYKVMVVGDMGELGDNAQECHCQVGEVIKSLPIDKVLSVGNLSHFISSASECGQHIQDKSELVTIILKLLKQHNTITLLIKGSRSAAMEQVIQGVQEKLSC